MRSWHARAMPTFVVRRHIAAPPEAVFAWLADVRNYTASTAVLSTMWLRQTDHVVGGVGAVRELVTGLGWFRERIVGFEPGRALHYRIVASIQPVLHEHGSVVLDPTDDGTEVVWTTTTAVRLPLVGGLVDRTALGPMIQLGFGDVLRACDRAVAGAA